MTATDWEYTGDANPEYGGAWFDLSTWSDGYVSAVRVTDLDSGCGFGGAVLVEHVTINGTGNAGRIRNAVRSCGDWWTAGGRYRNSVLADRLNRAELCRAVGLSYGTPDCILADALSDRGREHDARWMRGRAADKAAVKRGLRMMIADALMSYGHCDYDETEEEILQLQPDGPMAHDGWKADKRLRDADLKAYVESVHLS